MSDLEEVKSVINKVQEAFLNASWPYTYPTNMCMATVKVFLEMWRQKKTKLTHMYALQLGMINTAEIYTHAWIYDCDDDLIIDPTITQFDILFKKWKSDIQSNELLDTRVITLVVGCDSVVGRRYRNIRVDNNFYDQVSDNYLEIHGILDMLQLKSFESHEIINSDANIRCIHCFNNHYKTFTYKYCCECGIKLIDRDIFV